MKAGRKFAESGKVVEDKKENHFRIPGRKVLWFGSIQLEIEVQRKFKESILVTGNDITVISFELKNI